MGPLSAVFILLQFSAQLKLNMATGESPSQYSEHEAPRKRCPAGQYVSQPVAEDQRALECRLCEPGTFSPYASEDTSCLPCARCREDQEVVAECSPTSDRWCQCKQGVFYCDSMDCEENCFLCQRCEHSAILQPCNATRNTVCADGPRPEPGPPQGNSGAWSTYLQISLEFIVIVLMVGYAMKNCLRLFQWVFSLRKGNENEPGSSACRWSQPSRLPEDLETDQTAFAESVTLMSEREDSALMLGAVTCPGTPEDLGQSCELQEVVAEGGPASPERMLQTEAPEAQAAPGQAEVSASLESMEQKYEQQYFLKDVSSEATKRIYCEFRHKIPENNWQMFQDLIGLGEDSQHLGSLEERLGCRREQGREISVFKLMAALHAMQLHVCLQNIVNSLVADNTLGRHADVAQ